MEQVLAAPLVFLLILLGVQFAVWGIAQLAVQHAANHALQTTRITGGTTRAGHADARAVLAQVGGTTVLAPQITVQRDTTTAQVSIRGRVPSVVPFVHLSVSTQVRAPVERFRAAQFDAGNDVPVRKGPVA
ncbi:hypothetical protein Val02_62550 [Virgisporangium aliadipatigenens]|uniref:TadE-like protein n=1 Tax=Virgisporangium aliadipatigenens TaxID=741659 RepID=A0A8J3YPH9_9ACTN|nr:TadE family protein [Virgisporangium aliadipatigenens]GIJ49369.1 hypothetical protein Val02_62550 [Virgisporangium aliadipatigenens]